jgi:hypothetical protein
MVETQTNLTITTQQKKPHKEEHTQEPRKSKKYLNFDRGTPNFAEELVLLVH